MTAIATPIAAAPTAEQLRPLFRLDPDITFLNHGSFGATPRPVFEVYQAWQAELEREPVAFLSSASGRQEPLLNAARAQAAAYLNADPDTISFVSNATSGLNVIARSLPLEPGEEILTTDLEYGALDFTWDHLCRRAGARYINQPIPLPATTPEAMVDALWEGVTERTRAIFLSHITSATAITLPVKLVAARARTQGILTIVDGAHVPGHLDLDLADLGADVYAGNFHKWLCAPKGTAFLYVHPDQQAWIESLTISWGWRPGHTFVTRNQQQGTRDVSGYLAVPRAIEFQREHRWPEVRERCHAMLQHLRAELIGAWDTTPFVPADGDWFRQMCTIPLPGHAPDDLQQRLFHTHGIQVPITEHAGQRSVRVSVQGYTTDHDLDRLRTALARELGTGD